MKWYDNLLIRIKHRGQPAIRSLTGDSVASAYKTYYYEQAYDCIEVVNRGVNFICDASAEFHISNTGRMPNVIPRTLNGKEQAKPTHVRQKLLERILNVQPNFYENHDEFRRQLTMDLLLTGNAYQYFDGANLYHLPSKLMEVKVGKQKKITGYLYNGNTTFSVNEIIHTRDNSATSTIVGSSRLKSTEDSINLLKSMLRFQELFFKNGAIPGMLLTTPNALGSRIKERMVLEWIRKYDAVKSGRRPMILDADLKPHPLSNQSFRELDFEASVEKNELKILKALGVPPLLLDSGNNANISPNLKLFYEQTVLPILHKFISSYETFFGYNLEPDIFKVRALRPELQDAGQFYSSMVTTGIMTPNEARKELRQPPSTEPHADKLIIPANIAGSASNPNVGGRPEEGDKPKPAGDKPKPKPKPKPSEDKK